MRPSIISGGWLHFRPVAAHKIAIYTALIAAIQLTGQQSKEF
jgi:hypothetical protein